MTDETINNRLFGDSRLQGGSLGSLFSNQHARQKTEAFKQWFEHALHREQDAPNHNEISETSNGVTGNGELSKSEDETQNSLQGVTGIGDNTGKAQGSDRTAKSMARVGASVNAMTKKGDDTLALFRPDVNMPAMVRNRTSTSMVTNQLPNDLWNKLGDYRPYILHVTYNSQGVKVWLRNHSLDKDQIERVISEFRRVFSSGGKRLAQLTINGKIVYLAWSHHEGESGELAHQKLNRIY